MILRVWFIVMMKRIIPFFLLHFSSQISTRGLTISALQKVWSYRTLHQNRPQHPSRNSTRLSSDDKTLRLNGYMVKLRKQQVWRCICFLTWFWTKTIWFTAIPSKIPNTCKGVDRQTFRRKWEMNPNAERGLIITGDYTLPILFAVAF